MKKEWWEGKACPNCLADGVTILGQYDGSIDDGMYAVICERCGRRTDDHADWQDALDAWEADIVLRPNAPDQPRPGRAAAGTSD